MIAVRAGADTHHAVDAAILQKLGKDGYVVNISRGSVIDQSALVAALSDNSIAAPASTCLKASRTRGRIDSVFQCRADPAFAATHRVAYRDAGLRDRQPRAFFAGKPLAIRALTNAVYGKNRGTLPAQFAVN